MNEQTNTMQIEAYNLNIESITLLDSVTPDPEVQYKIGRDVHAILGAGLGYTANVFYNEKRVWRTFPITNVESNNEKLILTDSQSIYTFRKK